MLGAYIVLPFRLFGLAVVASWPNLPAPPHPWPGMRGSREVWPAGNYCQTEEAERENNICPKHSNLSQLLKKVRPLLPFLHISTEISGLAICLPYAGQPLTHYKPLTWRKDCSLRYCSCFVQGETFNWSTPKLSKLKI